MADPTYKGLEEFMSQNTDHWDPFNSVEAARNGDLASLQWMRQNGLLRKFPVCLVAARDEGHTETVEWLEQNEKDIWLEETKRMIALGYE